MANHGFTTGRKVAKKRGIFCLYGAEGVGKTYTPLLYGPGNIALISLDGRADDTVEEIEETGQTIQHSSIAAPADMTRMGLEESKAAAGIVVEEFLRDYYVAMDWVSSGKITTVVIDTINEFEETAYVHTTGTYEAAKKDFNVSKNFINHKVRAMVAAAKAVNACLIFVAREKPVYVHPKPTGEFIPYGLPVWREASDWYGRMTAQARPYGLVTSIKMKKAGTNGLLLDKTYREKDWGALGPIAYICQQVYPRRDVLSWYSPEQLARMGVGGGEIPGEDEEFTLEDDEPILD